jgi:hypothetical protein
MRRTGDISVSSSRMTLRRPGLRYTSGPLLLAGVVFGVNLLPAFGPPTWAVLVFFGLQSDLTAIPLVPIGALAATSGPSRSQALQSCSACPSGSQPRCPTAPPSPSTTCVTRA